MKIYTIRRKDSYFVKQNHNMSEWSLDENKARIYHRRQDAAAAMTVNGLDGSEILEHVCLPALPSDLVYVALPAEGDGVLGDWLEQYGLIDAAMVVRKHTPESKV